MDKKYMLTESNIFQISKELTIVAMEHGMIKSSSDPEQTANNVYSFFETIFDSFSNDNDC